MPKNLQKSLSDYLSKIKKQTPHLHFSPSSLSSATSKIFSGCKHAKSLSFSIEHKESDNVAATLEDIDRFLIENFRSLYGQDSDQGPKYDQEEEKTNEKLHDYIYHSPTIDSGGLGKGTLFDSTRFFTPPQDLSGSHRFFISPTSSGSLLEETLTKRPTLHGPEDVGSTPGHHQHTTSSTILGGVDDCIAVLKVSESPYEDFRRSMQEVIQARGQHKLSVDWDFMEEILFGYLRLNEKKHYRYILSAFIDLVVTLRQSSSHRAGMEGSGSSDSPNNSGSSSSKGKGREYF